MQFIGQCIYHIHTYRNIFGGVKFWQIAADKANSAENFGRFDDRSSVVSVCVFVSGGHKW